MSMATPVAGPRPGSMPMTVPSRPPMNTHKMFVGGQGHVEAEHQIMKDSVHKSRLRQKGRKPPSRPRGRLSFRMTAKAMKETTEKSHGDD